MTVNEDRRIEDVLAAEGVYVTVTSGMSMYPMLRHKQDTVIIRPKKDGLKKYDVPLYRRGSEYVLHRIVRVNKDGTYNIRGDNCFETEKNIPDRYVIGYLDGFYRGSKEVGINSVGYRLYARVWVFFHPVICFAKRVRAKIFGKNKGKEGS